GQRPTDQPESSAAPPCGRGEVGPDVELRKDEGGRADRVNRGGRITGSIEDEVIAKVHIETGGKVDGAWREIRKEELDVDAALAHPLEHRASLQAFTDRRRVCPQKRSRRVAITLGPGATPVQHTPS